MFISKLKSALADDDRICPLTVTDRTEQMSLTSTGLLLSSGVSITHHITSESELCGKASSPLAEISFREKGPVDHKDYETPAYSQALRRHQCPKECMKN